MKNYITTTSFWRAGLLVAEGSPITLSAAEAKYLGHALAEVTVEQAPAAVDEVTEVSAEDAPRKRK